MCFDFLYSFYLKRGTGSSVGIATDYGLDGPESNPCGWRDFPPVQTGPGAHPASSATGTGSFPRVKCGRGVLLTNHHHLVPRSWKSRTIPLPTLWATLTWNTSHSKSNSARFYHKCTYVGLHVKCPLIVSDFNETRKTQALDPNDIQTIRHIPTLL